jgi:hypothetical protein
MNAGILAANFSRKTGTADFFREMNKPIENVWNQHMKTRKRPDQAPGQLNPLPR